MNCPSAAVSNKCIPAPAACFTPGCYRDGEAYLFAAAIDPGTPEASAGACCLRIYDLEDGSRTDFPLPESCRFGRMYSLRLCGLPKRFAYCYRVDGEFFGDPCARRVHPVTEGSLRLQAAMPGELEGAPRHSPLGGRYRWSDRVIFLANVRGFTMDARSGVRRRGSFAGLEEKIPYLQSLGITSLELMPVFELCERTRRQGEPAASCYAARPGEAADAPRPDLWGFGDCFYMAPRASLAMDAEHPEKEFLHLVEALHAAGIELLLEMCFPEDMAEGAVCQVLRHWLLTYGIDGVRLLGGRLPLQLIAGDPVLSDALLITEGNWLPAAGAASDRMLLAPMVPGAMKKGAQGKGSAAASARMAANTASFTHLLRCFVKGDEGVLSDFVRSFLAVPPDRGEIHCASDFSDFTLRDLVTYSRKHNEANGEDNRDGNDYSGSWNCGVEGDSRRRAVVQLRRRQMRNFLILVFLSQGTPLLTAGDERENSQNGNNNPYCQDNETGWTSWRETAGSRALLSFVQRLVRLRAAHPVFRRTEPFHFSDYRNFGFPDLSYHGIDAWKPDFSGYSHSIGILYCENYGSGDSAGKASARQPELLYLAVNMYWQEQTFGLPRLKGQRWRRILDSALENPFEAEGEPEIADGRLTVGARTIVLLRSDRSEETPSTAGV